MFETHLFFLLPHIRAVAIKLLPVFRDNNSGVALDLRRALPFR